MKKKKRKVYVKKNAKKNKNRFYVYAYLDTRKPGEYIYFDDRIKLELKFDYEPFYVGKGCGNRYRKHLDEKLETTSNTHKVGKIQHIIQQTGEEPKIVFIQKNVKEQYALILETKIVKTIGRANIKKGP